MTRYRLFLGTLAAVAFLVGYADVAQADKNNSSVAPYYKRLGSEGKHNAVLNQMRIGVIEMEQGDYPSSAAAFDSAIKNIETIFATDDNAQKARSLWYEEGRKDFKGEPYERVMAYYYRGILDMFAADYENARADIKGGCLQDAFVEEEQTRCDFALMIFLQGWTNRLLGNKEMESEAFAEVIKLRPDFIPPAVNDNALIVVETGTAPRKLTDGPGHGELVFRRGKFIKEFRVKISATGGQISIFPMDDVAWHAMTRGGRPIDKIIKGKVQFRSSTESIGSMLTSASQSVMSSTASYTNSTIGNAGMALGLVGAASLALSVNTMPQADDRFWDNLPDLVHIGTLKLPAGTTSVDISVFDKDGADLGAYRKTAPVHWDKNGNAIVWVRTRSALVPLE